MKTTKTIHLPEHSTLSDHQLTALITTIIIIIIIILRKEIQISIRHQHPTSSQIPLLTL